MKPDALNDDCMAGALLKPRWHSTRLVHVKVGTGCGEYVRLDRAPAVDKMLRFKRFRPGERWQGARVWKMDGYTVFLELW
jgi:hypothetical protein